MESPEQRSYVYAQGARTRGLRCQSDDWKRDGLALEPGERVRGQVGLHLRICLKVRSIWMVPVRDPLFSGQKEEWRWYQRGIAGMRGSTKGMNRKEDGPEG